MRRHVPHKLRRQTAAYRKIPTNCRIFNRLRESAAVKIPLISLLSLCNENFDQMGMRRFSQQRDHWLKKRTRSVLFSLDRLFLRIIETFAAADSLCRAYFRTIGGILLFSMDSRLTERGRWPAGAVCPPGLSASRDRLPSIQLLPAMGTSGAKEWTPVNTAYAAVTNTYLR